MNITVNTLVTDLITGTQYLVLWVAPDKDYGYWFDLIGKSLPTLKFVISDVEKGIADGKYETSIFEFQPRPEETLSVNERKYRDKRWDMIKQIVEQEPEVYEKSQRARLIKAALEINGAAIASVYRLLDCYWRNGKRKNGLLPLYSNCGARGKARKTGAEHGNTTNRMPAKALNETDYVNFGNAIQKYYLTQEKRSLASVYEYLLQDSYTTKVEGKHKLYEPTERPSLRQFQYWYSKNSDIINETKKRGGERAFELNSRAVLGKSDYGLMGPGAQFQVDATVGDVYLVSQFDRSNIIGRPVLYFIVDAFSRMVVGMSVGLEGPSWSGLAAAIINMSADKVAFCKQYGVEISESDWPCRHVPASLLGDRGELISKNADTLVNMLGIRIVNAPPYRADLKGIVEQHFRTINENAVAFLPGSVKPDMSKRGGRDYRLDATLDIRQLTRIIINCVLYYNNFHYMNSFEKSEVMMAAGVEAIPIKLWNWGIENCSGTLRVFSEEMVKYTVLPTANATITEKGIRFKGLHYSCDRAKSEMWFEKARAKKRWTITISHDPRDMTNIYLWDNNSKQYDTCHLLDWNSKYAGKALAEIVYEQQKERLEAKRLKSTATEAKINLNAEIDSIIAEAKEMGKSAPTKSKKERVSEIRANRAAERTETQRVNTMTPESEPPTLGLLSEHSDDYLTPALRSIKERAEERLKNG